jgi:hypothetical protein
VDRIKPESFSDFLVEIERYHEDLRRVIVEKHTSEIPPRKDTTGSQINFKPTTKNTDLPLLEKRRSKPIVKNVDDDGAAKLHKTFSLMKLEPPYRPPI